LTEPYWSCKTV